MDAYSKYQEAVAARAEGRTEAALELLHESVSLGDHFKTRHVLYSVYLSLGRRRDASVHLSAAFRLNPKSDRVAVDYAGMLTEENDVSAAISVLTVVTERNGTYGPALVLLEKLRSAALGTTFEANTKF
jgi:predicted Zn-dependent protease